MPPEEKNEIIHIFEYPYRCSLQKDWQSRPALLIEPISDERYKPENLSYLDPLYKLIFSALRQQSGLSSGADYPPGKAIFHLRDDASYDKATHVVRTLAGHLNQDFNKLREEGRFHSFADVIMQRAREIHTPPSRPKMGAARQFKQSRGDNKGVIDVLKKAFADEDVRVPADALNAALAKAKIMMGLYTLPIRSESAREQIEQVLVGIVHDALQHSALIHEEKEGKTAEIVDHCMQYLQQKPSQGADFLR